MRPGTRRNHHRWEPLNEKDEEAGTGDLEGGRGGEAVRTEVVQRQSIGADKVEHETQTQTGETQYQIWFSSPLEIA
jgi:hypothetical protein